MIDAMRRRTAMTVLAIVMALAALSQPAHARAEDQGASWRSAPAQAPPPPPGAQPAPLPVALGNVGDIKFWAPNRGLLITGGTSLVPAGLYAYDGVSWHELSTVCGGADGRIAWAGPDDFWTISDQRPGQLTTIGVSYASVSLCHFFDGQVVGSYALPLGEPNSYLPMDAAACINPNDCWFGGQIAQPPNPNVGAFHLHWNGQEVEAVYAPEDHAVASMALTMTQANGGFQPTLFESVQLAHGDQYDQQNPVHPPLLHQISAGTGTVFHDVFPQDPSCDPNTTICYPLPEYGFEESGGVQLPVDPQTLAALSLSSDYMPDEGAVGPSQLWAVAGPDATPPEDSSHGDAHPIALRYDSSENSWSQVVPNLGGFAPGSVPLSVAAEPGAPAAWVTIASKDRAAHVARLTSTGVLSEQDLLGPAQEVGNRGEAGPIDCPGPHDCWLATNQGWLFHLTDGEQLQRDTDPSFASVIAFRPPDGGTLLLPSDTPPPDDSLANQAPPVLPAPSVTVQGATVSRLPLVEHMSSRVIHGGTLELSFTLNAMARVQLIARRHNRPVASTRRMKLRAGRRRLELRLDPRRWPTKLDFHAVPLAPTPIAPGSQAGGGSQTAPAPRSENSFST